MRVHSADADITQDEIERNNLNMHKAVLNILEDFTFEKTAAENTQKAVLNILDDFNTEKIKVDRINGELAESNKEMESFSYSISHDLRAPLRAINGYAQILNEDYSHLLDNEGLRLLNVIHENATRMGLLIDDLLAFSRLGRKEMHRSYIDMNHLIKQLLLETDKIMPNNADIKVSELHPVLADYALINQEMTNLISNAVKYSSKKEKPCIYISSVSENGETIYTIKDNGAGFDMKYSNKLFGVFQRLHTLKEFEGTGVGLAIVNRIIAKHHGKVWAEGKIDKGAVFHFSLPEKITQN